MATIIHMTTVHPRDDSRILHKEIRTLATDLGLPVALYVQDGKGGQFDDRNQCQIVDTGTPLNRLGRMTVGALKMVRAVASARPEVVFFHDPELIPWAALLRLFGIRVIYDVHEDYPEALLRNQRIPGFFRRPLSILVGVFEFLFAKLFDGIIAVTPDIAARFPSEKTVVVNNSPILDELVPVRAVAIRDRPRHFAYVGTINEDRNALEMIRSVGRVAGHDVRLRMAGPVTTPGLLARMEAESGWSKVAYDPWLSRSGVRELLNDCRAGLLLIKPIRRDDMTCMPIKMCEYMAASIPIIASDFPVWREIIEREGAGLVVNPLDEDAIVSAMQWMADHPDEAERMGINGRRAVVEKYHWDLEARKLINITQKVLNHNSRRS
jgi:glycosyltransferase involved in cell wall biosynthesis